MKLFQSYGTVEAKFKHFLFEIFFPNSFAKNSIIVFYLDSEVPRGAFEIILQVKFQNFEVLFCNLVKVSNSFSSIQSLTFWSSNYRF
jgi:hypothetical protein